MGRPQRRAGALGTHLLAMKVSGCVVLFHHRALAPLGRMRKNTQISDRSGIWIVGRLNIEHSLVKKGNSLKLAPFFVGAKR